MRRAKPIIGGSIALALLSLILGQTMMGVGYYGEEQPMLEILSFCGLGLSFLLSAATLTWACLQASDAESVEAAPSAGLRRMFVFTAGIFIAGGLLQLIHRLMQVVYQTL